MSKAKFAAAKELIDEKKYDEARAILKTIDHPTARDWEARLDKIAPPPTYRPPEPQSFMQEPKPFMPQPQKARPPIYRGCAMLLVAGVALFLLNSLISSPSSPPTTAPTIDYTQAAVTKAARSTDVAIGNLTATVIALTPSATITDTPIPSATSTFTITPKPPTPTLAPFGLKENPYPVGAPGSIRDGRLQVNTFARNQTATVKQANMFNDDPPAGGEYVLANITFYCDLPSSKTCNVTFMDLELVGKMGSIYKQETFVTMDTKFKGEAFGGGQVSGDVAFIVNSKDSNFTFIVNDLGSRTFFTAGG